MILITIALKMKSLMQYITDFFLKTFMNLVSPPALGSATYFFIPPFVASQHFPHVLFAQTYHMALPRINIRAQSSVIIIFCTPCHKI